MNQPNEEDHFHHAGNVLSRFKAIHTFMIDVDGVLTDGELLISENGDLLRKMNVRDGYAIKRAIGQGFHFVIVTGGKSLGVLNRLKDLGIEHIWYGVEHKLQAYEAYLDEIGHDEEGILYMGDDLPDLEVMRRVGLPTCPADAAPEIREISQYISPYKGGEGCVRDVIEKVLKLNDAWL